GMTTARAVSEQPLVDAPTPSDAAAPGCGAPGRPRDERVSRAIVGAALRQLEDLGYGRMSMESVASEAGVSRATVYRRYRDKADLVTAAVASTCGELPAVSSDDPLGDLVAFLEEFDARFAESCLEVIGCLLGAREEPHALALHRRRVVEPRTAYARALLVRAKDGGWLTADADVDLALQLLAGAVFARRVAGIPSEPGWARRSVDALCRGIAR
ncbi:MAG: TetR/AcrR family transcriptional regulator, partial [Acidimicrobiales bacterium]